jgi:uncharacterized protein YbjQ (UPF0145 family)
MARPPPPPLAGPPYRSLAHQDTPATEPPIHPAMVTVTEYLPGHRVVRALGIVHGVALQRVTTPSSNLNASDVVDAHQRARREALAFMMRFAAEMGANAVIGVRYATATISETQTEFLAYGTAVVADVAP